MRTPIVYVLISRRWTNIDAAPVGSLRKGGAFPPPSLERHQIAIARRMMTSPVVGKCKINSRKLDSHTDDVEETLSARHFLRNLTRCRIKCNRQPPHAPDAIEGPPVRGAGPLR